MQASAKSKRKRQKHQFPWEYVKDWQDGDSAKHCGKRQCTVCRKWYSKSTNASGWKAHMKSAHDITGSNTTSSAPSSKYENAVVDYVVEGGVTLRAAGGVRFKKFVVSLTNGYEPPSTRTILRRITELYRILEPLLAAFLCSLDSNRNLKGFYIITAHWVDVISLTNKSILFTILDVKCGTGVSKRVGTALFDDNGSDATAAITRLFQLVNTFIGYEQMRKVNHVRCADHFVQLVVLKVLTFIKEPTEQLRDALVKIRHSKVMRQQYRVEAAAAGFASKEPTHQDSPTRWNSTHEMCADASGKHVVLDSIMDQYAADIGHGALLDLEWHAIDGVSTFLRAPRQVMESLATDHKPTLDLVPMSVSLLLKHCDDSELKLQEIDYKLTTVGMKAKLEKYKSKLVQEPAIIAAIEQEAAGNSLFAVMFQPQHGVGGNGNEVDRYLSIGVVQSSGFIDILSWWSARKELLPGHYQMAMDYHETPATSTPSERVNSAAGREFTCTRQSLSSSVFIMTMCLRSWMNAGILKVKVLSRRLYRNHGLRKAEFTHRCLLDFFSFQGGELHALLGDAELRG
ncbi:hypothetical protein BDL97_06G117900 [Sphagnum fallax]|nr:hypothetical protein BDL97_06G117900 [Sphagnum fallax]